MSDFGSDTGPHPGLKAVLASPFDLVARARLALEGCTGLRNAARAGQPYTYAELHTEPPVAFHAPWDYADVTGRLLEALTLARIMTGTAPDEADAAYAQLLATCQREDGLISLPAEAWTHTSPVVELDWSQRGALMAWTTRYLALNDQDALHRANRLVHALYKSAVWEGETCWYPASFLPTGGWTDRLPPIGRMTDLLIGAQIVFPLARLACATGNSEALQLAKGLIRFHRERSGAFTEDGKMTDKAGRYLHSTTGFLLGTMKYAVVTGRTDMVEWVESAYRHMRELGTEFGFFPHRTHGKDRWQGDLCTTQDMIEIAILLGQHREHGYFADAERFGRNHLLESQILNLDWVDQGKEAPFCQEIWGAQHPAEGVTTDSVSRRSIGGFAGWTRYNDAFDPANPRLMQRCTGAGTRAIYDLWHHAITRPEGAVMVNAHFSRDSRWASVTSYLPLTGRIDVLMKTRGVLAVRVPPQMNEEQIEVHVNGVRPRHEVLRGGYAWLEALQLGDTVRVEWPLEERATFYEMNEERMLANWRGDTLLRMDPPGSLTPIYQRSMQMTPAVPRTATGPVKEIDPL
ncbi:MAG: hypothetical protein JWL77_3364 [Chthonomonadaceae bacterium]|nr:hypothetical protein [Chthonomonadaceae bacterium]